MFQFKSTPGRTCSIHGNEYLFFSGYSYLGMNYCKEFISLVKDGTDKYGVLFPSSRISNTRLSLYDDLEKHLSDMTGMQETVSFSSGYLAGKTISEILSVHTGIFVAPHSHPAITIKPDESFVIADRADWENKAVSFINSSAEKEFVLISDSINILQGTINGFTFTENIFPDKKIVFLIDDSHGIGVLGENGEGIIAQLPKRKNIEYILSYSLSKAFNIEGGAVSCSKHFAEQLRQHPNYAGSTAINPSLIHAFLNSKNLYKLQRQKLNENIKFLQENISSHHILKNVSGLPIFVCNFEKAADFFYTNKMIISSFSYPTPQSKKVNRIIVNALHTKSDLQSLSEAISKILN